MLRAWNLRLDLTGLKIMDLLLISPMTVGKLYNLSMPQFSHLWNGDNDNIYLIRFIIRMQ